MQNILYEGIILWGSRVAKEWRLPNGNIADIYFEYGGYSVIIEVKTEFKVSLLEQARDRYYGQSDFLYVAIPEGTVPQHLIDIKPSWASAIMSQVGLIQVGRSGVNILTFPSRPNRKAPH